MDFLKFLNNGYDPRLIYGHGGLGYKPKLDIYGNGLTDLVLFEPGSVSENNPTNFQLNLYEKDNEDLVTAITDESFREDPEFTMELINEWKSRPNRTALDKANLKLVNTIIENNRKMVSKRNQHMKHTKAQLRESEEASEEEFEEELVEISETQKSPLEILQDTIKNMEEDKEKAIKKFERARDALDENNALRFGVEKNRLENELYTSKLALEKLLNPSKYLQAKTQYNLTDEEKAEIIGQEIELFDADEEEEGVVEYFNENSSLVKPLSETEYKDYLLTAPQMKDTILKPTGEGAGKSMETHLTIKEEAIEKPSNIPEEKRRVATALTGEQGSLLLSFDDLLKSRQFEGANSFCIDLIDQINDFVVECKKYDGKESFEELYNNFTKDYNNFYLSTKNRIYKYNKAIIELTELFENIEIMLKEEINEALKGYGVSNIDELKEELYTTKKALKNLLSSIQTNGEFDENKFKLYFYRNVDYPGITIGINKFPKPEEYAGIIKSPNSKLCFDEIKKNRQTSYDIKAIRKGKNFGYIDNIVYEGKANNETKNKIIQEVTDFNNKMYSLLFAIATDDALLKFNYTDFLRNRIGKYEDITNIFRGAYNYYSAGAGAGPDVRYDSVVIPIDCFMPVNLKEVYKTKLSEKKYRQKKLKK